MRCHGQTPSHRSGRLPSPRRSRRSFHRTERLRTATGPANAARNVRGRFPAPDPIPGWHPSKLPESSWGAIFRGKTASLPDNLVGVPIAVCTSVGTSWAAAVIEVLERSERRVRVRHSGKPSKENHP